MELTRPPAPAGHKTDRRLAVAIAMVWAIVLTLAPYDLRPWGQATPSTGDLASFWTEVPLVTDFKAFWTAASLVREGAGPFLFDLETQRAFQVGLDQGVALDRAGRPFSGSAPYFNPPPLALLFVPLTFLPMPWAFLVWASVSLSTFFCAVALPLRGRRPAWTPAVVMLTYAAVADTLLWGQVNGFFTLALSLGLAALAGGRPLLGGALLGLLWLKPQQALLFPLVFLLKGRWREFAGMATTGLGLAVLSLAMVGPSGMVRYLNLLRGIGGFYSPPFTSTAPERMANWRAVLIHLWPSLPEATGSTLMIGLGVATLALSLLAWRGRWDPASPRFARQMLVVVLASIVASPHSHFHATALLLAPVAMMIGRVERERKDLGTPQSRPGAAPWARLSTTSWNSLLMWVGYALALVLWPFRVLSWLLVPYFLLVMLLLILQCLRSPSGVAKTGKLGAWTSNTM